MIETLSIEVKVKRKNALLFQTYIVHLIVMGSNFKKSMKIWWKMFQFLLTTFDKMKINSLEHETNNILNSFYNLRLRMEYSQLLRDP